MRTTKPRARPYKLADGDGLVLHVAVSGTKTWRVRRQVAGVERVVTIGHYPAMSLAEARAARDRLALVPAGTTTVTFEAAARAWHESQRRLWAPHHAADVLASLEREAFPALASVPVSAITAPLVLAVLRPLETRGAVETAHRLRQRISAVMDRAVALGQAPANPVASLRRVLAPVVRTGRRPAVTTLAEARAVLLAAEAVPAHPVTRLALRLLALTVVRPGELRGARWSEFAGLDGSEPLWTIPAARMKATTERRGSTPDHVVPLAPAAVDVLAVLRGLTGHGPLPFPSPTDATRPLSENALGYLMHRAGYHSRQTAHGWRATFSTVMNERRPTDRAIIDLMLAHVPKEAVERAYNRASHTALRREIAEEWAKLLIDGMPEALHLLRLARK